MFPLQQSRARSYFQSLLRRSLPGAALLLLAAAGTTAGAQPPSSNPPDAGGTKASSKHTAGTKPTKGQNAGTRKGRQGRKDGDGQNASTLTNDRSEQEMTRFIEAFNQMMLPETHPDTELKKPPEPNVIELRKTMAEARTYKILLIVTGAVLVATIGAGVSFLRWPKRNRAKLAVPPPKTGDADTAPPEPTIPVDTMAYRLKNLSDELSSIKSNSKPASKNQDRQAQKAIEKEQTRRRNDFAGNLKRFIDTNHAQLGLTQEETLNFRRQLKGLEGNKTITTQWSNAAGKVLMQLEQKIARKPQRDFIPVNNELQAGPVNQFRRRSYRPPVRTTRYLS